MIAGLRGPGGREESCEAAYIAGCDGVRSIVRETMGTGFAGGTYRHLFYVADVEASGLAIDGEGKRGALMLRQPIERALGS